MGEMHQAPEQIQATSKCFICQAPIGRSPGSIEVGIYAVVGNKFVRYGYGIGGSRPREGEHSIFTPIGRTKILASHCDACKSKCHQEWLAQNAKSKKDTKIIFVGALCVAMLAVASFPLVSKFHLAEAWHILPIAVVGLSVLCAIGCLMEAYKERAKNKKGFSMQPSFTNSESFKREVAAIATSVDVSAIRCKFGSPSSLGPVLLEVKTMEAYATKEKNLLFIVSDDLVLNLSASDFYEGRYWYLTSATSGESLPGFDADGNSSGFKWIYPDTYEMKPPENVRFIDDKNANIELRRVA